MTNFWKALNETEYSFDEEFFQLSGGAHFFGSVEEPSVLFIRECYDDLISTAFDMNVRKLRISGNPGIGKPFYGYYLLYHLAMLNKTVIFDTHTKSDQVILFEGDKAFYLYSAHHADEIRRYLKNPDVWYIVDGKKCDKFDAKTILICSPLRDHYKDFDKRSPHIRYMPVWS